VTFTPDTTVTLAPNTNYWFILGTNSNSSEFYWNNTEGSATSTGPGSILYSATSTDQGASWVISSPGFLIEADGVAVPEPSTLIPSGMAVLLGLGTPGAVARRGRTPDASATASTQQKPRRSALGRGPTRPFRCLSSLVLLNALLLLVECLWRSQFRGHHTRFFGVRYGVPETIMSPTAIVCNLPMSIIVSTPCVLQDGGIGVPVVRQLRILGRLVRRDGPLGSDGKVDPALAVRTSADEPRIVPPSSHQWVMNGASAILQAEINRLHRLPATLMRTGGLGVDDVRCHLTLLTPLSIEGVHLVEFLCRRS